MTLSKLILASLLASLLLLHLVDAHQSVDFLELFQLGLTNHRFRTTVQEQMQGSLLQDIACGVRCSLSSHPNLSQKSLWNLLSTLQPCPTWYFGNQGMCPRYARLTTHDGKRKCP
ncbi:hypothetical protein ACSQ67_000054 [Phaseolus vulgaris]